ncbi:hypothetical protein LIER_28994 [Lithospermum erythrorhizon]|uniref:Uncharacterized protein n=1 Tax=Lithospermum erythrorhizon TaxID=34254 RepID=A0AAV3RNK8_LITER
MKVQSPTRLHNHFAHYQLTATEAAYAMSLQWAEVARVTEEFELEKSSFGESLRLMRDERDSAFDEKEKATQKYNDLLRSQDKLISNHAATEGKFTSELETLRANSQKIASDFKRSKDDLGSVWSQLEGCIVENDNLSSLLSLAENSYATAVDDFKESSEYLELLKGNTTTLLHGLCQNVSTDFPGISSHFKNYVSDLGEDYVVELFDDGDEDVGAEEGEDKDDENDKDDDEGADGEYRAD